jgi:glycosyl transferase family 9 (putative heptosyltransferase)
VPALRWLRTQVSGRLTLAAHRGAARLLAGVGEVDVGLAFDDPRLGWVFGMGDAPRPAPEVVAWLEAPLAITPLVVAPSRPRDEQTHCAEHLLASVGGHGLDVHPLRVAAVRSDDVLIHPGSGSPVKNWPADRFAAVSASVGPVQLIVGEADLGVASVIDHLVGYSLPRLEHPPLDQLAARLAGCRAYLGNDSGVSHLAGLVGARTLALFGPTPASVWHPLGPHVQTLDFSTAPDLVANLLLTA